MRFFTIILGLFCTLIALAAFKLWPVLFPPPTEEELQAVAIMEEQLPMPGSNAFTDLWLMEYDIPQAEKTAIMQADIQQMEGWLEKNLKSKTDERTPFPATSSAEGSYPKIAGELKEKPYCPISSNTDCLTYVRNNLAEVKQSLQQDQRWIEPLDDLAKHGHLQLSLPNFIEVPFPKIILLRAVTTSIALDFTEGRVDQALERSCTQIHAWRRIAEHNDIMVAAIVLGGLSLNTSELLAQMLAELPLNYPLPASCQTAFAPELASPDLCRAVQGEYRMQAYLFRSLPRSAKETWHDHVFMPFFNADRTIRKTAIYPARFCAPELQYGLKQKQELQYVEPEPIPEKIELFKNDCLPNFTGCMLAAVAKPNNFNSYLNRRQLDEAIVEYIRQLLNARTKAVESGLTVFPHEVMQDAIEQLNKFEINLVSDLANQGLCADWQFKKQTINIALPWPASRMGTELPHTPLSCEPEPEAKKLSGD